MSGYIFRTGVRLLPHKKPRLHCPVAVDGPCPAYASPLHLPLLLGLQVGWLRCTPSTSAWTSSGPIRGSARSLSIVFRQGHDQCMGACVQVLGHTPWDRRVGQRGARTEHDPWEAPPWSFICADVLVHVSQATSTTYPQGRLSTAVHHRRRVGAPLWTSPPPDQSDNCAKKRNLPLGNLVVPFLVHTLTSPRPPPQGSIPPPPPPRRPAYAQLLSP